MAGPPTPRRAETGSTTSRTRSPAPASKPTSCCPRCTASPLPRPRPTVLPPAAVCRRRATADLPTTRGQPAAEGDQSARREGATLPARQSRPTTRRPAMARDAEPRMSHAARGSEMDNPPPESQPSQRITLNRAIHRDAPEVDTSGEADGRYRSAAGAGQDRVHPVAVVVPVAVATVADVQVDH